MSDTIIHNHYHYYAGPRETIRQLIRDWTNTRKVTDD